MRNGRPYSYIDLERDIDSRRTECNPSVVQALQTANSSGIRPRRATEISFGRIGHRYDCRRKAPRATLIPSASFLGSFRDFHEPFLNELRQPRHGIRVDLDSGQHIFVSPVVNLRRRPTQLKAHTALPQAEREAFVRLPACHIPSRVLAL